VLEARDLYCERGERALFRKLSFSVKGGELLRIAGANGSGKTSLLRILCGLLTPAQGEVRWKDAPIASLKEEYSRELVYLGHAPAVKADLSAGENLAIACGLAGTPASRERIGAALTLLEVPDAPVRKLSQGQKRRAALARLCLAAQAPLWLLDEPFTALDPAGVEVVKTMIDGHVSRGAIVVYTTHQDPGIAASRVLELG
jgi:heme exporter protein A